ncbi:ketosynthase [Luteimonas qiangzhengi]|uniref:ketosynthase n=1 Tax=Luteimonas sp. MJ146 TaxID=3129240 RepID=UPI0031BBA624
MNTVQTAAVEPAAHPMVLIVEIALVVGYGVLAHLSSARDSHLLALAALLVLVLMMLASPLAARRLWAWIALPLLTAVCWSLYRVGLAPVPLLLVPVAFIGVIAWMFGRTLAPGRVPLITRIASIVEEAPDPADAPALDAYTRGLTRAWTVLLLVLGTVNLVLAMIATPEGLLARLGLLAPVTITHVQWSWFANLLNYGIVAGFFILEFQLRKLRFPGRFPSFLGFLRQMGGLGPAFWRDQLR